MPKFSKRRIHKHTLTIFKSTGRIIKLLVRKTESLPSGSPRVPTDLLAASENVNDSTELYPVYIFGKFDRTNLENEFTEGRVTQVSGVVTIPILYQSILDNTAYIDPYCDGSKFERLGLDIDEEGIFIFQSIRQVFNPTPTGIEV